MEEEPLDVVANAIHMVMIRALDYDAKMPSMAAMPPMPAPRLNLTEDLLGE
jgi:hypothetical protein